MKGFHIQIDTADDLTGIKFALYDNDERVMPQIDTVNFDYLVDADYSGEHTLELTYYREGLPEVESDRINFYSGNFTLPTLTLEVTATVY
ncbi:hypothetical protein [uncultured Desulfuromusa sp.]|uniref:hypothetical protein n=1 Tax=uncultured Desulfuromusa sp. TaxID=219183 RepID=UPI002AA6D4F9|nr:hypothetical protein [uncultured Desulfuromusa sp.]